ncbi:MAG: DUF3794 domain-containing protein, partial [Oscillospiraceae bacterium]|nr:DUF3794 domain-containing protein [Oscillospiraceae bacterium]
MELIKESVNVNETVHKGSTQTMVDGDIIVPDVMPDVLKILQVDAVACINHKSIENGRLSLSGKVDLKILYMPDSETEKIKSILTSFDFVQPVENGGITTECVAAAVANAERAEFSMINSRKLHIKAIASIDYEIFMPKTLEIASEISDDEEAEIKKEKIAIRNLVDFSEHEISVREQMEIPNGQSSIKELLKADVKISDTEYKTVTGKIVMKGVVCVSLLYSDENNNIEFAEEEIPFTEVIDSEDVNENSVCDIDRVIMNTNITVGEDSDGDNRLVDLDITVGVQVTATQNVEIEMISDCYEPYKKTNLIREEIKLEEPAAKVVAQNTVRECVAADKNVPAVSNVYNVITEPHITKAELQRNKLLCEGRIEAYILYLSDSSENPVCSIRKEIPFSYMLDCDAQGKDLTPEIKAEIKHTGYNLNAAGEIELRCNLALNANIIRERNLSIISDVQTEELPEEDRKGIVIYFVQKGDTLCS